VHVCAHVKMVGGSVVHLAQRLRMGGEGKHTCRMGSQVL